MAIESGCFFVSDRNRILQTINVIRTMRNLNFKGICAVLLLDELFQKQYSVLSELNVEHRLFNKNQLKNDFPRTGLKLWIPFYFECVHYIVMDSDLIIINLDFLSSFQKNPNKMLIVGESELTWQENKKGICTYHKDIIGKRILQTGILGFSKAHWDFFFYKIYSIMKDEPSDYGDMVSINIYFHRNHHEMLELGEENCLVLRPTMKGPGTQNHIPNIQIKNCKLLYKNKEVSTIHYTMSEGKVVTLNKLFDKILKYQFIENNC